MVHNCHVKNFNPRQKTLTHAKKTLIHAKKSHPASCHVPESEFPCKMAERKSDDDENGDVDCGDERALFVHYFRKGYS